MVELGGIVILGIAAQWLAWRAGVPAILPLILTGLAVGPIAEHFWGHKLINPEFDPETGHGLFAGEGLFHFVELSIAVILFEGGLTLKRSEIKKVGPAIGKLITLGSFVTFIGGGLAAHYIIGLSWQISFLFGALIIVTGPTVIAPILRNVPLNKNVSTVLKWEGILIDPIGALAAVIVYDFIRTSMDVQAGGHGAGGFWAETIKQFFLICVVGFGVGYGMAWGVVKMIHRKMIPHYLLNVFTLASVIAAFVLANVVAHDSGLLTVVIMGMAMANMDVKEIKEIYDFKESITVLLIAVLFILLSANINVPQLEKLIDIKMLLVFASVVLIIRPIGVFLSAFGSHLTTREKLFVSWVGPRGIVAAGIASLFGLKLSDAGVAGADFITPLVFLIVLGTVLINATTARFMSRLLGVQQDSSSGIMIVGGGYASRLIGKYLMDNGRDVTIVDTNAQSIETCQQMGLQAIQGNVYTDDFKDNFDLLSVGYLFAMTGNDNINKVAIERLQEDFGENGAYRFVSSDEVTSGVISEPTSTLFSKTDDFINFSEVARDYPKIHEYKLSSQEHYESTMKKIFAKHESIPLFLRQADDSLDIITSEFTPTIHEGDTLVYLGKAVEAEPVTE